MFFMKDFKYSIEINKPKEFVFEMVMDKSVYPEWAKAWGEGMDYEGEWKEGENISFFDKTQGGTKVIVEEIKPYECIKAKHIAMVNPAKEEIELTDEMMKKWIGSLEQYYFYDLGKGKTKLEVVARTDEAFEEMMGAWNKALEYFKEICERD